MARPQRNNVDYFPFYCEDGKKMYYLEETYGNDGFATFMKLLRELAKSDFHYLDLSKNTTTMFLSARCKVSKETLDAIINDLVELEKFDSLLWNENRIIWCQDFVDSIQDAYSKRSNECITYDGLLILLQGLGVRKPIKQPSTVPVKPQSIVKETILNETKQEERKTPTLQEVKDCISSTLFQKGMSKNDFPVEQLAEKFWNNYETKGWNINGQLMVKWKPKVGDWINEHLKDPERLLGKSHGKVSAQDAEEMDIAVLKHLKSLRNEENVQSENDNNRAPENNRMRRIS